MTERCYYCHRYTAERWMLRRYDGKVLGVCDKHKITGATWYSSRAEAELDVLRRTL